MVAALLALSLMAGGAGPGLAGACPSVVGELRGHLVLSTASGRGLWLGEGTRMLELSGSPGCAANVLVHEGSIYWKECPPVGPQRIVRGRPSGEVEVVLRADLLSGPFLGPEGPVACLPGEVLVLEAYGAAAGRVEVEGLPGSACSMEGEVFWVDSEGRLRAAGLPGGERREVRTGHQPLAAVSPIPEAGLLLLERVGGGCVLIDSRGRVDTILEDATFPVLNEGTIAYVVQRGRGPVPEDGEMVVYDPAGRGLARTEVEGSPACPFPLSSGEVVYTDLRRGVVVGREWLSVPDVEVEPEDRALAGGVEAPYMHQLYDTPDWFDGGWSCGPTSCMMAGQYYDRLTPDSIWCSWPSPGHYSEWGAYIPEMYTFLGHTYDVWGVSPGNVWVQGSHGFICRDAGGAYWDYMALWMEQHGLYSAWAGTSWSTYTSEIDNGWPMVASTSSIYTPGHILLFAGYYEDHSILVNDPYGDQNQPGWGGSYNGEDVVYDWYPYNNGHVQVHVAQVFYARSDVPTEPDTLVDNVSRGFRKLGPCRYWHETHTGYGGAAWWTYSTSAPPDTCVARWEPKLPWAGEYEVLVYVPPERAEATGIYAVHTSSGPREVTLDQSLYSDQWASLGTFELDLDSYLRLGDYTGEHWEYLAFDAALFSPMGTGVGPSTVPATGSGFELVPNPCIRRTMVELPTGGSGRVTVYDLAGREVASMTVSGPGCSMVLSTEGMAPGTYVVRVDVDGWERTRKLVVLGGD
ncbi:T9SS type A sorting domain-containing protein [Candidatus Fermentibacteria bacterium]|nr:T9SS type A sorting domain-containing protein [Candidatus Fermentibacteria bacterium]